MIETLAKFYVNILEPAVQILFLLTVVILLYGFISYLRHPEGKNNIAKILIINMFKILKQMLIGLGIGIKVLVIMLQKSIMVIFAAFRDFFNSKI
jgi:hypothetical protein